MTMNIKKTLFFIFLFATKSHAGWFDDSQSYINSCVELYKKNNQIELYVKAIDIKKIEKNKYEYTPVFVVRGKETVLDRQYCEYYPEEQMIYTGIADSVKEQRRQDEVDNLKKKLILEKKINEQKTAESKHQAELKALRDKAMADEKAKEVIKNAELQQIAREAKLITEKKARQANLEVERIKAAERIATDNETKKKNIEREKIRVKFTPLLSQCIKKDQPRVTKELNDNAVGFEGRLIIAKEQKPISFDVAGEYLIVNYSYYSYDKKKHDRWNKSNGPTAGRMFKNKAKATCLISELAH